VDYSGIATGLSDDKRKDFLVDVSWILIRLYETEWHYYLFTPKKRHSNTTPIVWPQSNNQISKFPKTAKKVEWFRRLQPMCVHIKSSKTNKPINMEGKRSFVPRNRSQQCLWFSVAEFLLKIVFYPISYFQRIFLRQSCRRFSPPKHIFTNNLLQRCRIFSFVLQKICGSGASKFSVHTLYFHNTW
jgi:hypothetical protein